MKKKVLLLAVSCKKGGLCPGGIDLEDPKKWIRIVANDGESGAVYGKDIDFAKPLDVIEFYGRPMPQGKQQENWIIENNQCKVLKSINEDIMDEVYKRYSYNLFWGNFRSYLTEEEFNAIKEPSESIMKVFNVRIYKNDRDKAKIDFDWDRSPYRIKGISMTDQDFYDKIKESDVIFDKAYIVVSIPKDIDEWVNPITGNKQAYKFVSKIYQIRN